MRVQTFAAAALAVGAVAFGVLAAAKYEPVAAQTTITVDVNNLSQNDHLGNWVSVCQDGTDCRLQFVDVLEAGDPSGGSIAAFILPDRKGLRVEFGIAEGLSFENGGFYLARDGFPVWNLDKYGCLDSGVCTFSGPAADALVRAFSDHNGETLEMHIFYTDSDGIMRDRHWPMLPFAGAFDGFMTASGNTTSM